MTILCVYEITAVLTGKIPAVSVICRRHRTVEAVFLAWLVYHLHHEEKHAEKVSPRELR